MGVTYDAIDDYIESKPVSEDDKVVIERMNQVTEHKRMMPPMNSTTAPMINPPIIVLFTLLRMVYDSSTASAAFSPRVRNWMTAGF